MAVKEEWDDVSDLSPSEMSSVQEWKEQFEERYDYVGRLVPTLEERDNVVDEIDENDVKTKNERPKLQQSESSESDLEVINPDQAEFSEAK